MITRKQAAYLIAAILGSVSAALYKCQDTTPVLPNVPVLVTGDAGVVSQVAE